MYGKEFVDLLLRVFVLPQVAAANPFRSPPAFFLEGGESRGEDQAGDEDLCLCFDFDFDDEAMESQTEWNQNGINILRGSGMLTCYSNS